MVTKKVYYFNVTVTIFKEFKKSRRITYFKRIAKENCNENYINKITIMVKKEEAAVTFS